MLPFHLLQFKVESSSHGVDNRLRLFKDLLLHERIEVALHDLLNPHLEDDEQACQHERLEGRKGVGNHNHWGVSVGDGVKLLNPFGDDGIALVGGGDTIPANDGDQPKLGDYHKWSSIHNWSNGHQWNRRLLTRSGFSFPNMTIRKT